MTAKSDQIIERANARIEVLDGEIESDRAQITELESALLREQSTVIARIIRHQLHTLRGHLADSIYERGELRLIVTHRTTSRSA